MEIIEANNQESLSNDSNLAVYVRRAQKSYGVGKSRANILQSLNMAVKSGTM